MKAFERVQTELFVIWIIPIIGIIDWKLPTKNHEATNYEKFVQKSLFC